MNQKKRVRNQFLGKRPQIIQNHSVSYNPKTNPLKKLSRGNSSIWNTKECLIGCICRFQKKHLPRNDSKFPAWTRLWKEPKPSSETSRIWPNWSAEPTGKSTNFSPRNSPFLRKSA